jgi:hypothetical protein
MPKQMGNSRRGPDDLDRAFNDNEERLYDEQLEDSGGRDASGSSSPGAGSAPVLGEGEKVGEWTEEDEDDDVLGAEGTFSDDEGSGDGGGYQAASQPGGSEPSESERPTGRHSRWGMDGKVRSRE